MDVLKCVQPFFQWIIPNEVLKILWNLFVNVNMRARAHTHQCDFVDWPIKWPEMLSRTQTLFSSVFAVRFRQGHADFLLFLLLCCIIPQSIVQQHTVQLDLIDALKCSLRLEIKLKQRSCLFLCARFAIAKVECF